MSKSSLANEIITKLSDKLGHEPSGDEIAKNLNGAGLMILADSVVNDKPTHVSFAENIDSKLEDILIPYINGEVRCNQCMSYDKWEYLDADYEGEEKFFRFKCQGHIDPENATFGNTSGDATAFCFCEHEVTIYLDKTGAPIWPKVRK